MSAQRFTDDDRFEYYLHRVVERTEAGAPEGGTFPNPPVHEWQKRQGRVGVTLGPTATEYPPLTRRSFVVAFVIVAAACALSFGWPWRFA